MMWLALYLIGAAGMALYFCAYLDELGIEAPDGRRAWICGIVSVLLWPVLVAMSIIAKIDGR